MTINVNIIIKHQHDGQFILEVESKAKSGEYCKHEDDFARFIHKELGKLHRQFAENINQQNKESINVH